MNRERKEFMTDVVLVAASVLLTIIIILSSGTMIGNSAGRWTETTVMEGE